MEIFKELKKLGYKHYIDLTIEELDALPIDNIEKRIEYSLIIDWLRNEHDIVIEIVRKKYFDTYVNSYAYEVVCKVYKNKELEGSVVIRDNKNNHIFYSYEEAREQAILKCIELCQKEK